MDYKTLLKNYGANGLTFVLLEEKDLIKIQVVENKLVFYYPNIVDERSKMSEREEIETLQKELVEMGEIFSETDSEYYLKQKELEKLEKNFSNKYNREWILDKKNSFLFSLKIEKNEENYEEKVEIFKKDFYEFLVELIKIKRLEDKIINPASIVYSLGLPCEVNGIKYTCEDKWTYNIRKRFDNLYY